MLNTKFMMDYLSALSMNNNREWYHANKDDYKKANGEFENLLQALILEIGKFDSSILQNNPKDLTFKLVRDTRFSHDKSPYNPAFRAHISSRGKLPVPVGYYIMIKPGDQSFLGGGPRNTPSSLDVLPLSEIKYVALPKLVLTSVTREILPFTYTLSSVMVLSLIALSAAATL